tara:strand:+ start:1702 stop:7290 length:5589 start_codon:yes stop_codon:yes gene_type:complete
MVEFRKKSTITTDTMVSQYLPDMYDGGTPTAKIEGGMTKNKYLFEVNIPSKPTFGNADLKSLDFDFYVNSIEIGENSTKNPEVASFLLKGDVSITEGFQSRVDANILTFSSVIDGYSSLSDTFDGNGNSHGDGAKYENIARTIIRGDTVYTTIKDVEDYGQKGYKWRDGTIKGKTRDKLKKDFGVSASTLGITDSNEDDVKYIKVTDWKKRNKLANDRGEMYNAKYWRRCVPNDAHIGIGYEVWIQDLVCKTGTKDMVTTEGYGNEVTPTNTIFEVVRGSAEYSSYDATAKKTELTGVGVARFNTENFLSAPQSLELLTIWNGNAAEKDKVTYPMKHYADGSTQSASTQGGPQDRQEVVLVKTNIPYPTKKASLPSKERDSARRTVLADVSENNFISEGHGLSVGDRVRVDDDDEDVWDTLVGTAGISSADLESTATAAYVRNITADTFQLASSNNDSNIYALSSTGDGADNRNLKIKIQDASNEIFNAAGASDSAVDDYDWYEHASTIEFDVNIKKMSKAYSLLANEGETFNQIGNAAADQDNSQHFLTLRRGMHVVFGTEAPEANDTLYDYIARMANLHNQSGAAPWKITGPGFDNLTDTVDADALWSLRGSCNHNKTTTQNACFGGFSVMNTEHGMQIIPFNGVQGTSTASVYTGGHTLYLSDHDIASNTGGEKDLYLRQQVDNNDVMDETGATGRNVTVPLEDTWSKFIIAVDPNTSIKSINSVAGAERGQFSLGRLFVADSGGNVVKLGSGASDDGRNFLDIGLFGDAPDFYSFNESAGKVSGGSFVTGEKYKITDVATSDWTGWGGDSSAAVDEIFIATGNGAGNTGNKAISLSQDPSNWPKHMSIWVTNYKTQSDTSSPPSDDHTDTLLAPSSDSKVQVLIDNLEFNDFNYEITNSSQLNSQRLTSPIKIGAGKGFQAPYGLFPSFDSRSTRFGANVDTMSGYYSSTPTLLSIGLKNRDYLSVDSAIIGNGKQPWTTWPYGFWLNEFSCSNLSKLGSIPDDHIKGTVSMANYNTDTAIPLGKQFSQHSIDHQAVHTPGSSSSTHKGTIIPHNLYSPYDNTPNSGQAAFSTSFLDTGLTVNTNDISEKQFTCNQETNFAGTDPTPIRVGDTVRLVENNSSRGGSVVRTYEYTVATVTGDMDGVGGLIFTVSETPTLAGDGGEGNADDWAEDYAIGISTPALCRNFSQKGGFQMWSNSSQEYVATKRENIACSARIMDIISSDSKETTLVLDTLAPVDCDDDEEYVVYLYGETPTFSDTTDVALPDKIADNSANAKTGLIVTGKDLKSNIITLDWDGKDNAGTSILNYDNIHRLYISPWRYWVQILINVSDSDNKEVASRAYGNVQLMNNNWTDANSAKRSWVGEGISADVTDNFVDTVYTNRTGIGTTYNEFLFNDTTTSGVNGAYLNNWDLDREPENSSIECDVDFGFGQYDDEKIKGGFTGKKVISDSKYNRIKMPKITSAADLEPNDTVKFLLDYVDVGLSHTTTLRTRHDSTYPPYLFAVYEDELPAAPILSVVPYKEDPFLPEFNWTAGDTDLWYGILHVDSQSIDSQYHNAIFHIPMNEDGTHGAVASATGNNLFANDTTAGSTTKTALFTYTGATIDSEGLAGNCIRFDGVDDVITYTPASGNAFPELSTAVASGGTGQASIVVHYTPSNGIDGSTNNIFKGMPFQLYYNATSGKVVCNCYTAASNYVQLTSPDIITDGQTPTCIIATIDNSLKAGNCKLYINGALVDQSGLISTSAPGAGGNNWYNNSGTPAVPYTFTDPVTIGRASNALLGRLEELVIYKSCIYPVVPSNGKFILDKPLKEIQNGSPISNNARLFIKDYHNIRGNTTDEVAASSPVSFRKAAFRLVD